MGPALEVERGRHGASSCLPQWKQQFKQLWEDHGCDNITPTCPSAADTHGQWDLSALDSAAGPTPCLPPPSFPGPPVTQWDRWGSSVGQIQSVHSTPCLRGNGLGNFTPCRRMCRVRKDVFEGRSGLWAESRLKPMGVCL